MPPTSHLLPATHTTFRELSKFSLVQLIAVLDELQGRIRSPWAILLVRFSDDKGPSPALKKYQDLFTSKSTDLNMVEFFSDMSHGRLDVSGSKVFGWYTLAAKRADYVGNVYPQPAGKLNRNGLLDLARATAAAAGVALGDYSGVVVSGFQHVDLCGWVGGMAALCDSFSLTPSLLGQEMGHGYGLDHARLDGSADDYRDPWDVMSTAAYPSFQAPHPEFDTAGPGLNACSMRSRGWLDETRVWVSPTPDAEVRIQLRPLHRTDLPGFLAAQLGPYLVEFRAKERWDAAIPRPCVLVHRFELNHSYLMPAQDGSQDLVKGSRFVAGNPSVLLRDFFEVEVTDIDAAGQTATILLRQRAAHNVRLPDLVAEVFGGVAVDGGGRVFVNGKVHIVPPRSPVLALLEQVGRYIEVGTYETGVDTALAAQREALAGIVRIAIALHSEARAISGHPPGYTTGRGNR